jgi:NDP-sugar pyrophosphorylase family protein
MIVKVLIITIAGTARRFNQDLEEKVVKSIYYRNTFENSLLYQLCLKAFACDKIIIVGGYKIEQVSEYINTYMSCFSEKIELIYNSCFESHGSGYSFFLGIKAAQKYNPDELIFTEGDLYFADLSFQKVLSAKYDVITINTIPVEVEKAVILYKNLNNHIKYIYDIDHKSLVIREPFAAIYNSAQVWKFLNLDWLYSCVKDLSYEQITGTNLEIINSYFSQIPTENISFIVMDDWINCNTLHDYDNVINKLNKDLSEK